MDYLLPSKRAPGRAFPLNMASAHPEKRDSERERESAKERPRVKHTVKAKE